jgi:hypothetical protein
MQTQSPRDSGDEREIVTTPTRARAGVTGHNVRYVLLWGTVGAVVAFTIVCFGFFAGG